MMNEFSRKEDSMKKVNKKVFKFLKVSLLLCMIFSQLASPVKVLADQIVPSYNLDIGLDDKGDEDKSNDEFIIISDGTKQLVDDKKYILEIVRSFEYTDGILNENENKTTYDLVLGSLLTTGINVPHEIFNYNGVSYVDVNVYEVTDDNIDISTYPEEDYPTLLTTDSVENIMNTSFEEGVSYNENSLTFVVAGDTTICDTTEGYKCSVTLNDTNNIVGIDYALETGDFNPNKEYHIVLEVNDKISDLVIEDIELPEEKLELDFSKLLPGVYNVEYSVRDEENIEVLSNNIEFTYTNDDITDKVDFIKNSDLAIETFFSYDLLTDLEKDTLGNDYRYLDNIFAFIFDLLTANSEISSNYNLFDDDTRYHVVMGDYLVGAFNENSDSYTVEDVLRILTLNIPKTTLSVVDKDGQVVEATSFIENGMKLVVDFFGEKVEYDFLVYADVDGGYVEESDISALIDKILKDELSYYDSYNLDFNGDEVLDVVDASILGLNIYNEDYGVGDFEIEDTITSIIESDKDELYTGETFEVMLSLDGFVSNNINAIDALVTYDKDSLKLEKVEMLSELFVGNSFNDRFMYATIDVYSENKEDFVKLTFSALAEGTHTVSVTDLVLISDGVVVLTGGTSNEIEVVVNRALHTDANLKSLNSSVGYFDKVFNGDVLEYTLYVDSSVSRVTLSGELSDEYATTEDLKEYVLTGDNTQISINVTAEDGTVKTYKVNVRKVYKSSNNNLKDIVIEGYDIDFDKDTLEYKITVGSDVTSLDISALVEDSSAWAKIEGNENFKEGVNTVTITVYAQNGETKTYKILVNKEKAEEKVAVVDDEENDKDGINGEKLVIIILIILVTAGLLYLIFKKEDEEELEPIIEQIKPKKDDFVKKEEFENSNYNDYKNKNKHKK